MRKLFATILLGSASALAVQSAQAQDAAQTAAPAAAAPSTAPDPAANSDAAIVVTGSRVITNGNNSPTPVTALTTESLTASKPTTVFEALMDQPLIGGGKGGKFAGSTGQGGNNNSSATLNLRGLGATRGLVLLDGHRVSPQNQDGSVDMSQIPQLLLQRVDIQTGGSSAVYGSDAITGVVNFIIDRKFKGFKFSAQSGVSQRGDEPTYDFAGAYGKDLFDGRGHFETSLEYRYDAGLLRTDRDYIQQAGQPSMSLQGNGCSSGITAANCAPYFISRTAVDSTGTFGGKINSRGVVNPYAGYDFTQNGVATPFVSGTAIPGSTSQLGGGGGYSNQQVTLATKTKALQAFARFDYDFNDGLHFYVMGYYDRMRQQGSFLNLRANTASASSNLAAGFILTPQNAFLPAYMAQGMQAAGVSTFQLGKYFSTANVPPSSTTYTNDNYYINSGLEGKIGSRYNWQVSYAGSRAVQANQANETWSTARLLAGLDSVNVNGVPTCWVSTQPQYAGNFPGCVAINPFGPTSMTAQQLAYVEQPTHYKGVTSSYDFSGSFTGSPFDTWAGPVNIALSGEYRKLSYYLSSDAPPANIAPLDCNALGLLPSRTSCVQQSATNIGTSATYANGTAARSPVSQRVGEVALEANVPLLKDVRFARDLSLNGAIRYADYSSTGNVIAGTPYTTSKFHATTWKVGLDWHVDDKLTLRATHSRDFRAPNLSELYTPGRQQGLTTGQDLLTGALVNVTQVNGQSYSLTQAIGGNPNLKPEVGITTTLGMVFKPSRHFSLAVDGYFIKISNAITLVDGSAVNIQNACYDSGGSSPYCALQVRPGGLARNTANTNPQTNAATLFYTQVPLNVAQVTTKGFDVEGNYNTELWGRRFSARVLGTYQPTIKTTQPGAPTLDAAGVSVPIIRIQGTASYNITKAVRIDWTTRWRSKLANVDPLLGYQVAAGSQTVAAASFSNLNLSAKLENGTEFYLNVQNVFDKKPPAYAPLVTTNPGGLGVGFYPGDDPVGRYFIMGVRMKY